MLNRWNSTATKVWYQTGTTQVSTLDTYSAADNHGGLTAPSIVAGFLDHCLVQGNNATKVDGTEVTFTVTSRLDTPFEIEYYKNGGILQTVLRRLAKQA